MFDGQLIYVTKWLIEKLVIYSIVKTIFSCCLEEIVLWIIQNNQDIRDLRPNICVNFRKEVFVTVCFLHIFNPVVLLWDSHARDLNIL